MLEAVLFYRVKQKTSRCYVPRKSAGRVEAFGENVIPKECPSGKYLGDDKKEGEWRRKRI